jgi:hypothetical protein
LEFAHPLTGRQLKFLDPLPADLVAALGRVEGDSMGRTAVGEDVFAELTGGTGTGSESIGDGMNGASTDSENDKNGET